jgi:murein DD-endopeptidase MepM/ murein hydrolase activator NlpD
VSSMKKDYLTIVIQPAQSTSGKKVNTTKSFEIPIRIFYYLIVAAGLLTLFGINGSDTITKNIILRKKARLLETSLTHLRPIEKRVANMSREARIIRNFVGFDDSGNSPDISERLGKGGSPAARKIKPEKFDPQIEIAEDEPEKPLHMRAVYLRDDLHDLTGYIAKKNKKLNYLPSIMPVKNNDLWITSTFGWRRSPFTGMREMHNGLDISGKRGVPIIVTADGTVESAVLAKYFGNIVTVRHEGRFKTAYGHMLSMTVKEGQKVTRGQVIGYMGSTGLSTGYHVHYIVTINGKDVNPYDYILNRTEVAFASNAGGNENN